MGHLRGTDVRRVWPAPPEPCRSLTRHNPTKRSARATTAREDVGEACGQRSRARAFKREAGAPTGRHAPDGKGTQAVRIPSRVPTAPAVGTRHGQDVFVFRRGPACRALTSAGTRVCLLPRPGPHSMRFRTSELAGRKQLEDEVGAETIWAGELDESKAALKTGGATAGQGTVVLEDAQRGGGPEHATPIATRLSAAIGGTPAGAGMPVQAPAARRLHPPRCGAEQTTFAASCQRARLVGLNGAGHVFGVMRRSTSHEHPHTEASCDTINPLTRLRATSTPHMSTRRHERIKPRANRTSSPPPRLMTALTAVCATRSGTLAGRKHDSPFAGCKSRAGASVMLGTAKASP